MTNPAPTKEQLEKTIAALKDTIQMRDAVISTCQAAIKEHKTRIAGYEADIQKQVDLKAKETTDLETATLRLEALKGLLYPQGFKPDLVKALIAAPHKSLGKLEQAFIWDSTPQGWVYWNEVSTKRRLPATAVQELQRWLINYLEDQLASNAMSTETTTT